MRLEGEYSLQGTTVRGWARSPDVPEPLWLELVHDGLSIGATQANLQTPDNCGFFFFVPPGVLESGGKLLVRVCNGPFLPGQPLDILASRSEGGIQGEFFTDRGHTISGWAFDPEDPEKKLRITAWENGKPIIGALASGHWIRPQEAEGHGFRLQLPFSMADGKKHQLVLLDEKLRAIPGGPIYIRAIPENLSDWISGKPALSADEKNGLAELLEGLEYRNPGVIELASIGVWSKTFPHPGPQKKQKVNLGLSSAAIQNEIQKQKGLDIRFIKGNPDYVLVARDGEKFHPNAIALMLEALNVQNADLVYADAQQPDGAGIFKPAFDEYMFYGEDYLGPFIVNRKTLLKASLKPDDDYWSARFKLAMAAEKVIHLPRHLTVELPYETSPKRLKELNRFLENSGIPCVAEDQDNFSRLRFTAKERPMISIIIPTRDRAELLKRCLESMEITSWPNYEVIIMDNDSADADSLALLAKYANYQYFQVVKWPGLFNYAAINNHAASIANGELLCLLNNDTEIIHPDWLEELALPLIASNDEIGAVGAKLLWPNNLVQHGGVIVGLHELAAHVGNEWMEDEPGYMNCNQIMRQYSSVTAACLLTPKKLFLDQGGFDERAFPVTFNDVDYCLRLREAGKQILWTPHCRLIHHESASRGSDETPSAKARAFREMRNFRTRWGKYADPFYNPNLPLSIAAQPYVGLAFPPRARDCR